MGPLVVPPMDLGSCSTSFRFWPFFRSRLWRHLLMPYDVHRQWGDRAWSWLSPLRSSGDCSSTEPERSSVTDIAGVLTPSPSIPIPLEYGIGLTHSSCVP